MKEIPVHQVVVMHKMLKECIDWLENRFNNPACRCFPPPSKKLRHCRQLAGIVHAWLKNGRSLEISGSFAKAREVSLGLMSEASNIALVALWQPELLTEEQWLALTKCIDDLQSAPITFRLTHANYLSIVHSMSWRTRYALTVG